MFDQISEKTLAFHLATYFPGFKKESFFVYQISKLMELFLRSLPRKKATYENVLECIRNAADILHQNPITSKSKSEKLLSSYEVLRQQMQVVKKALEIVSEGKKAAEKASKKKADSASNVLEGMEEQAKELEKLIEKYQPAAREDEERSSKEPDWMHEQEWKAEWLKAFQGQKKMEKMKKAVLKCMIKHEFSTEKLETELANDEKNLKKASKNIMEEVVKGNRLNDRGEKA